MFFNPFDLTGPLFLELFGALFLLTVAVGVAIPIWLRADGHERRVTDPDELAMLAGGTTRFAEALVVRLMARGALLLEKGKFRVQPAELASGSTVEHSLLSLPEQSSWGSVQRVAAPYAALVEQRLVDTGLFIDRGEALQLRVLQTLPYLLLFAFGAIKWEVGQLRDKPVGFLAMFLFATAIFALFRFAALDRKTKGGRAALAEAKEEAGRLQRAPTSGEAALAVALFGTAVLATSQFGDFHRLRASSSDSGSAGSGDSGGGGCGGGGCGGCGGG